MARLEQRRVAVLNDDGGAGQGGKVAERVAELPVGHAPHEVGERLAFHHGHEPAAGHDAVIDAVIATGQRPRHGRHGLTGEAVGIALAGVDDDLEPGDPAGPGRRQRHVRTGLLARPGRLPEDNVPAPGPGEHQLRAVLPGPIGYDVDRRSPPDA